MEWKEQRKEMDDAIKGLIIPVLREKGFKGSYPHLRRPNNNKIDVIGFQFSQWGPQLYVEIGTCPASGMTFLDGSHYPPEKIKYYQCGKRIRIGDQPFDFENNDCKEITSKMLAALSEADNWWEATTP
jgi:Domain of unknown function (DUF4304)